MLMTKKVLLLGRTAIVLNGVEQQLDIKDVALFGGTSLEDVQALFEQQPIDIVIMGAGIDLEVRLQIIQHIFTVSKATTVHMKDWNSGPQGMLPFVNGIVNGLAS
jgi:hypothetical protein